MSNSFCLSIAVDCVRNITEANRCEFCDKSSDFRVRYYCGHTACSACVAVASDCLLCLTPPIGSSPARPISDGPLTTRVRNASKLLDEFQKAFGTDVYKRHRLTEQLKVEKSLFPECIQAPVTYYNKNKSSNSLLINKETKFSFLGERISPIKKLEMQKSNYVQQWLDQNEENNPNLSPRIPFADLNVNRQSVLSSTPIKKRVDILLDKVQKKNFKQQRNKKKTHFKTSLQLVNSQSVLDNYLKPVENVNSVKSPTYKLRNILCDSKEKDIFKKNVNDESGIVIDCEPIVIDESQSVTINKDKEALLAVQRADEIDNNDSTPCVRLECSEKIRYTNDIEKSISHDYHIQETATSNNVPFLKRHQLFKSCNICKEEVKNVNYTKLASEHSKNVTITIENNSFITTIKVFNSSPQHATAKEDFHSNIGIKDLNETVVQTSFEDLKNNEHENYTVIDKNIHDSDIQSQDLFTNDLKIPKQHIDVETAPQVKNVSAPLIIADSDSDIDVTGPSEIEVQADIHRSCDQLDYGVFNLLDEKELQLRKRATRRGLTPGSTDSSEKENYDPNRLKRIKLEKENTKRRKIKKQKSKSLPL